MNRKYKFVCDIDEAKLLFFQLIETLLKTKFDKEFSANGCACWIKLIEIGLKLTNRTEGVLFN